MAPLLIKNYKINIVKKGRFIALFLPFFKLNSFQLLLFYSAITNAQFPSAKDCISAYRICDATQSYHFVADTNPGLVDDSYLYTFGSLTINTIWCISGNSTIYPTPEWHPAWFVFTPQYSGEFGFLICPDVTTVNWQWALFENPVCGNLGDISRQLRCNTLSPLTVVQGCTGIGFLNGFGGGANGLEAYVNVIAGNTYVLYCSIQSSFLTAPQSATLTVQGAVVTAHPDVFNYPGCTMSAEGFTKNDISIYPNPFTNSLQVESASTFKTIALYDVAGKEILNQKFANNIDVSNLASGMYFLNLTSDNNEVVVRKVIKE